MYYIPGYNGSGLERRGLGCFFINVFNKVLLDVEKMNMNQIEIPCRSY